jgi:hypothetical protein
MLFGDLLISTHFEFLIAGNTIFSSTSLNEGWDGKLERDARWNYVYILTGRDGNGREVSKKRSIHSAAVMNFSTFTVMEFLN